MKIESELVKRRCVYEIVKQNFRTEVYISLPLPHHPLSPALSPGAQRIPLVFRQADQYADTSTPGVMCLSRKQDPLVSEHFHVCPACGFTVETGGK